MKATDAMFGGDLRGLDEATLLDIFSEVPTAEIPRAALEESRPLLDVLCDAKVFASKGEARRLIQNGGLYLNGERITDEATKLTPQHCLTPTLAVVRTGKKNYHLLRVV
jgi:tyrosyl-tRNA synthetase